MSKIRFLCAALLLVCACAKSQNTKIEGLEAALELDRKLLRETRAELQSVIDQLQPLLKLASQMNAGAASLAGVMPRVEIKPTQIKSYSLAYGLDNDGIEKLSENHYRITRDVLEQVLQDPTKMAGGARLVPSIKGGQANGFKLYAIRPSSIYSKVGLKNGDTIHRINGYELTTPDKALDVYVKLKSASELRLEITRRGQAQELIIEIN
jgi:type II secretion system protein C